MKKLFAKIRRFARNLKTAWREAKRVEQAGVLMTGISIGFNFIHLIFELRATIGGSATFFWTMQNLFLMGGLAALVAACYQRYGSALTGRENDRQRAENELKRIKAEHAAAMEKVRGESRKRRRIVCENMERVTRSSRDLTLMVVPNGQAASAEQVVVGLVAYCDSLALSIWELFDQQIEFRVSFKAFISPNQVVTIARDTRTLQRRPPSHDHAKKNGVASNTDFFTLLSSDGKTFVCDNLLKLPGYENTSPGWEKKYTAAMGVQIGLSHEDGSGNFECAGFLFVDCLPRDWEGPIFCDAKGEPDEALKHLLWAHANLAFPLIKRGRVYVPKHAATQEVCIDPTNFVFVQELYQTFLSGKWLSAGNANGSDDPLDSSEL